LPGPGTLDRNLRELTRSLTPFCLSILDIDDFPDVRLQYGDTEADETLRLMADTLRLTLRPDDLVCRLEGARYGVLLGNCAAPQASAALERVREALVLAIAADEGPHFTFSAGVVESHRATSMEDLLEQARAAAKDAHANGGNRVAVAHD
jgi:diguanylate cyclase